MSGCFSAASDINEVSMGFSENLEALLVLKNVTQDEIARLSGVTAGAVTGWRKGSLPRKESLKKLCNAFGISEDDLISDTYGLAQKYKSTLSSDEQIKIPLIKVLFDTHGNVKEDSCILISIPAYIAQNRKNLFAFIVEDDGYNLKIPQGVAVVVDPNEKQPKNGSIVAVEVFNYQELSTLWNQKSYVILRTWNEGAKHLMLSPYSHNKNLNDIIIGISDIDSTIEVLGTIIWFQPLKTL